MLVKRRALLRVHLAPCCALPIKTVLVVFSVIQYFLPVQSTWLGFFCTAGAFFQSDCYCEWNGVQKPS